MRKKEEFGGDVVGWNRLRFRRQLLSGLKAELEEAAAARGLDRQALLLPCFCRRKDHNKRDGRFKYDK